MTPALAHGSVFCSAVTRATRTPSPLKCAEAKWNWSAAFQMSDPPPLTDQPRPPRLEAALPANPGPPMSPSDHPSGSWAEATDTLVNVLVQRP
jgi:hypothetical protein